jgi:hypothetical protein
MSDTQHTERPEILEPAFEDERPRKRVWPVFVGLICWLCMAIGFQGLKVLMGERPQFIGKPLQFQTGDLLQESPTAMLRKVHDDVSSYKEIQAERTDIEFHMRARRDYRGLRTIIDMAGDFQGRYTITNPFDEPVFVLFKCPHPRPSGNSRHGLKASALDLNAGGTGIRENTSDAWFWSGELPANGSQEIRISYHAASVRSVQYKLVSNNGIPIKAHRVKITVEDLPNMDFVSGDGKAIPEGNAVVWERNEFLPPEHFSARIAETRSLHGSLKMLLGIGPIVSLLFLVSPLSVLLARRSPTALQVITISAGFLFYFPLVLYLSAKFTFVGSLMIAALVPGILLLNYTRVLLGPRIGLFGGALFLVLFHVFPTLSVFAGWNRGMVLLCLAMVTLYVLIDLQNRALSGSLRAFIAVLLLAAPSLAENPVVEVTMPGTLVRASDADREPPPALLAFGIAEYDMTMKELYVEVRASLPIEVILTGGNLIPVFSKAVHLVEVEVPPVVQWVGGQRLLNLRTLETGKGVVRLQYRVPITSSGQRRSADVPMLGTASGTVVLKDRRPNIEFKGGHLWEKATENDMTRYEIGVAAGDNLLIEAGARVSAREADAEQNILEQLYGIRVTRSQQLTVVNSDGSCTHFAEFELPPFHPDAFELTLPAERPPLQNMGLRALTPGSSSRPATTCM